MGTAAGSSWAAADTIDETDSARAAPRQIYQQRTPDGRTVLTDRPQHAATTERTWQAAPEDAEAGRARREEARLAAQAVNDRIARQIEAQRQRDLDLEIERMRLAAARADADAARANALAAAQPIAILAPGYRNRVAYNQRPVKPPKPSNQRPVPDGYREAPLRDSSGLLVPR